MFSIIANLLHFGMVVVGLDYGYAPQMRIDAVTGGSPYGATTIAGGDGLRQPSDDELMGARYQGHRIAEVAKRLHGTASLFEPPVSQRSSVGIEQEEAPMLGNKLTGS